MNKRKIISIITAILMLFSTSVSASSIGIVVYEENSEELVEVLPTKLYEYINENKIVGEVEEGTKRFIIKYKEELKYDKDLRIVKKKALSEYLKVEDALIVKNDSLEDKGISVIEFKSEEEAASFAENPNDYVELENVLYIQPDYPLILLSNDNIDGEELGEEEALDIFDIIDIEGESEEAVNAGQVVVVIMDTGIDINHEAIKEQIHVNENEIPDNGIDDDGNGFFDDVNGWNFFANTNDVYDEENPYNESHGTHIAGIIAGNSEKINSLAPNAKILPIKVFENGVAYTSSIIEAIEYVDKMGIKIVNASFGSNVYNAALEEAIANSNALFVCAAGNGRTNIDETPIYPAAFELDNIISVTSVNDKGGISSFANYGPESVDIAAPGENVYSAYHGDLYNKRTGTSMAAAYISGVAAAVLETDINLTAAEIKARILDGADKYTSLFDKVLNGNRVNVENAILNIACTEVTEIDYVEEEHPYEFVSGSEAYELFSQVGIKAVSTALDAAFILLNDGTLWGFGSNIGGDIEPINGEDIYLTPHYIKSIPYQGSLVNVKNEYDYAVVLPIKDKNYDDNCDLYMFGNLIRQKGAVYLYVSVPDIFEVKDFYAMPGTVFVIYSSQNDGLYKYNIISSQLIDTGITDVKQVGCKYFLDLDPSYNEEGILILKNDGTVYKLANENNQYALGDYVTSDAVEVARNLVLKRDGTVWQIVNNTFTQVTQLNNIVKKDSNGFSHYALRADGTVWSWENNNFGQLGDGTTINRDIPQRIQRLSNIKLLDSGYRNVIAVDNNDNIWIWG